MEYKAEQRNFKAQRELMLATQDNEIVVYLVEQLTKEMEWQFKVLADLADFVS